MESSEEEDTTEVSDSEDVRKDSDEESDPLVLLSWQ